MKNTTIQEVKEYRQELLLLVCTIKKLIVIYGGDDHEMNEVAREANQLTKLPLYDRHKILRFISIKPLSLESWR